MLSKSTLLFTLSVFLTINIGVALWRIYTAAKAATTVNFGYAQNGTFNIISSVATQANHLK